MDDTQKILKAVEQSDWEALKTLISADAKLEATRDANGVSLVMMLAYRGARDVAAAVSRNTTLDIFEATAMGDTHRLAEILAASPDAANSMSADGWTPLHLAGFFGEAGSAKILLDHGASVSAYGSNYMRNLPLHAALAGRPNEAIVRLLLEHGADVRATAATNITALHLAASRGNQAIVDLLLAKGADKAAKMDNGKRPADLARDSGFAAMADALG